jgi:cell division protein FtsI (penicillin-binding protein 3)
VTRATLEAALAARSTPIDRSAIARSPQVAPTRVAERPRRTTSGIVQVARVPDHAIAATRAAEVPLPDVAGMSLRDGVRRLHEAGFRLRIEGTGRVLRTVPEAGAAVPASSVVRVVAGAER